MSIALRMSRFAQVVAALALMLGVSVSARAADTVDVAARIAAMNTVATNTVTRVGERQTRAINRMVELDAAGKADRFIFAAAQAGKRSVNEAAERGRREINQIASRTVAQLRRQGAAQDVIAQVTSAREAAATSVNTAALAARDAITAKADELTGAE